jgi:NADH-quinone oxidoreductase subunit G
MADPIKVTINGQEFGVEKGARLIDVCRDNAFNIPSFCYYQDLALQASCRMCLVRIDKMPKLQTSCTITCTDGMVVTTQSEEIEKAQRAMSEFLLANHPLDCPVCDRGGECELQEMVMDWGNVEERFLERKNAVPEKFLSPIVANDPQRCILCKRCTRVCDEWMGEEAIEAANRGVNTVIGTYGGWLGCSECGNCIEVCPTGTLLDAVYRHETRPWEMDQTVSTCTYCSDGCQLSIGSRGGEVHRIVARDRYVNGHNGEFLCIKGRFAHGFVNSGERIKTPMIRYQKGAKLIPTTWDEAVRYVGAKLKTSSNVGVVASPRLTNESVFTLARLGREAFNSENFAVDDVFDLSSIFDNLTVPLATHRDIRFAKTILLIGGEPEEEQPFTAKQIRQAVRNNNAKLLLVSDRPSRLQSQASQFIHINKGSYDAFALGLADAITDETLRKLGAGRQEFDDLLKALGETAGDLVIMVGGDLSAEAQAVISSVAAGFGSPTRRALLHPLPYFSNSIGAHDMSEGRKSVDEVVRGSSTLYIAGSLRYPASLADKDFVVVQELFLTETAEYADVLLPACSFAEMDGTYTNNDGLVQRVRQSIVPVHQSRPDWMIANTVAREIGVDLGYSVSASGVFKSIADSVPAYAGLRYPALKDESRPVQVKHKISARTRTSSDLSGLRDRVSLLSDEIVKITEVPKGWPKLHKIATLTGRTPQFHLLANGNPKPESLLVSPLEQFNLDGTPKRVEKADATAVGARDRLDDKETVAANVVLR